MRHIANSKIGTIQSKPNVKYLMIRLPREYVEIIGQRAHIYKTDHEGHSAFLIVPKSAKYQNPKRESRVSKLGLDPRRSYVATRTGPPYLT